MTAKEFLLSVQRAKHELKLISARKKHYSDLIFSIGSNIKPIVVQTSGNTSKTETAAVGLVDLNALLEEKEKDLVALIEKAEKKIDLIEQEKFREVLIRKYLCGQSWKTIRDEMGYKDEKSVYRCHGYALRELQKLL